MSEDYACKGTRVEGNKEHAACWTQKLTSIEEVAAKHLIFESLELRFLNISSEAGMSLQRVIGS